MNMNTLGNTDLSVTPLGYGTAELGLTETTYDDAADILHAVLDAGINVIDTAACYQDSEVKIGQAVADRRREYVLVTKCGDAVDDLDAAAWTPQLVSDSIERSLRRLKTDHLDVVLLHSCDKDQLDNDDMLEALLQAKRSGKTRYIGYSGDDAGARSAVAKEVFDVLETSVNIADQQAIGDYLPTAKARGMGVIAKRPLANAAWRKLDELGDFYSEYARPYAERIAEMGMSPTTVGFDGSWTELALRFSAFEPNVDVAIVGSTNLVHLREDLSILEQGPLPQDVRKALRDLWQKHDDGSWTGRT